MLYHQTPKRRLAGKLIIVGALAVALPLTATRAIDFVDIAAPPPPPAPPHPPTPPDEARGSVDQAAMRADLATAKADLLALRRDQATADRDSDASRRDSEVARRDSETARRDIETARRDSESALREIDGVAGELRKAGQDPEAIKAAVRASMKAVEAIDVDAITREAMAAIDPALIERSLAAAEEGIRRAEAEIDAIDRND